MTDTIRFATAADAERIASIYRPFVDSSAVSFESEPPSADEMATRIARIAELQLPWLVMIREPPGWLRVRIPPSGQNGISMVGRKLGLRRLGGYRVA